MFFEEEEIFILPAGQEEQFILYAPLRSKIITINPSAKDMIEKSIRTSDYSNSFIETLLSKLKSAPYINIMELNSCMVYDSIPDLSLALTLDCNLNCVYCHSMAGEFDSPDMSEELLNHALTYSFKQAAKKEEKFLRVFLAGGGEPTYNYSLFKYAVGRVKQIANDFTCDHSLIMSTNGFYNNDVADFIMENFSSISFSLDGNEEIQNSHRPTKNGKGSYSRVFQSAKYFYNSGFNIAFRATISNLTIERKDEFFSFFETEFPNSKIGVEALNPLGRGRFYTNNIKPPTKDAFVDFIRQAYEISESKNLKIMNSSIGSFDVIRASFCGAVRVPGYTVSPNGDIMCCTRHDRPDIFSFGKFVQDNEEPIFDENKINHIRSQNVFNYPECQDCFCKYNCGGDCFDLRTADLLRCEATKEIGHFMLKKLSKSN
jgi:uncharacterized protein